VIQAYQVMAFQRTVVALLFLALIAAPSSVAAFRAPDVPEKQQKILRDNFALCVEKLKGPYTENFCVCPDGRKTPVRGPDGQLNETCPNPVFCAAYRAPWAEALAQEGVYLGNIFSRDLYLWDTFPDHNDLVRGYILEQYFVTTNPKHKLSQLRAFGGLSGSEYEIGAAPLLFERYLAAPEFNDTRDFLLAFELQKRFFVRDEVVQIEDVRTMSLRIQKERLAGKQISLEDYIERFQITPQRMQRAKPDAIVMHPGPIVRGLELANEVADGPQSCVHEQVANGVKTRMAILATLMKGAQ